MPGPEPGGAAAGSRRRPGPKKLRCEGCLDVLSLRHAWDVRSCSCGALLLSGRPARPVIHWLSRPGGGWTETDDDRDLPGAEGADVGAGGETPTHTDEPGRKLGFSPAR